MTSINIFDNNNIDAVLFDMDGLLLDTESIALARLAATVEAAGFRWSPELGHALIGRNAADGDALMAAHYGERFDVGRVRRDFLHDYENHLRDHGVPCKPGAQALLDRLRERNVLCALVTSSRRHLTELKLQRAGVRDYFGVTVCGDEVRNGKPNPEPYLVAATKLSLSPMQCLALEDSLPGLRAALAAGMRACWVPEHDPSIAPPAGAVIFSNLSAVQRFLFGDDQHR